MKEGLIRERLNERKLIKHLIYPKLNQWRSQDSLNRGHIDIFRCTDEESS